MDEMLAKIVAYVRERDWEQFHNPKDVAISLSLEASEVLEHFQWKNEAEIHDYVQAHKDDIGDELIDVLYWVLLLSHYLDIDIPSAFERKMAKNDTKYPVNKARGRHDKYTAYQEKKEA